VRYRLTNHFRRDFDAAPPDVQRAFWKQLRFLLADWRHPSLYAHPWPKHGPDAMQARVKLHWRFYYRPEGDTYEIYALEKHKD